MRYWQRLILTISILIALSFGIGGTVLISASFQISLEAEIHAALQSFESVQSTLYLLNSAEKQADYTSLESALNRMADQGIASWQALALTVTGQSVIYQNQGTALEGYPLPAMASDQCSYTLVSDSYGQGLIAQGIITAEAQSLTLKARFDLSPAYQARAQQKKIYFTAYFVMMALGVLVSAVLSYALTRPLHNLTVAVRRISGGDLSTRSGIASGDEFGQLSRDFDAMADKLQENISRLESEMQRQESFMGAFAHELKTPMTSIIGFADLLRQGNLEENTRIMAAEYIYSEGRRLEKLSFKLLELLLLKKDAVTMKRVWLSSYLGEVAQALSPNLKKKGIRLVYRAEQKRVAFEPDLVKSLLYNLIDNASKAMDNGGIIAVKGTAIPGGCQFQVADNGRGMEQGELAKITEAFYRVDKSRSRQQGGAGLGLALCVQIVELHSGSIRFDSEPGKGTKVTVTLYGRGEGQ